MPAVAQQLADVVVQLGRERAGPDPRRIGLGDPQHEADRARPDAAAGSRRRRHGVGRGDERIGPMIHVQHDRLGALEQDALAAAAQLVQPLPHRFGVGQDLRRQRQQPVHQRLLAERRHAQPLQQRVVVQQQLVQLGRQRFGLRQIGDADRAASHLVLIGRTDAAAGGADLAVAPRFLAGLVDRGMQRQDQHGIVGDPQRFRA